MTVETFVGCRGNCSASTFKELVMYHNVLFYFLKTNWQRTLFTTVCQFVEPFIFFLSVGVKSASLVYLKKVSGRRPIWLF
jgi:hypothetical protein